MSLAPPDLPRDAAKCVPPIPVPAYGGGGAFSVACAAVIAGPALACLEKVLDLPGYGAWNTFVPTASVVAAASASPLPPSPSSDAPAPPPELAALAARPGYAAPGARIRFAAVMVPGGAPRSVDLVVTALEAFTPPNSNNDDDDDGGGVATVGYRVAWKAVGLPRFVLRSERVQEFVERRRRSADRRGGGGGVVETHYATWETFGGAVAYVLPGAQLEGGFSRWVDGLRKVVEEGEGEGEGKEEDEEGAAR
ncbi:hypothetical protein SAMD00023353_0401810 [Rosellinia necatrix]|uniref:Uncharacterized protein n=1 Tax=Rosellinia necatrix TaxID=77044 RepID=A0A1S7UJI2_ROSNE|nr:hypothetical protein SAMD00023353_0401810 [Rosellinia necatrix]